MIDHAAAAPRGLRCHVEPDRERVVVRPVGEIDLATVELVERPLGEMMAAGFEEVVVDLAAVSFMDSTGLRMLIRAVERARADGIRLWLDTDPAGPVQRLFEIAGVLALLPIRPLRRG